MKKWLIPVVMALGVFTTAAVHAQAWPSKPVTLVVPFPPGGSSDTIARAIGAKMQEKLGQPVVVENTGGAGGTVGSARVARARRWAFLARLLDPERPLPATRPLLRRSNAIATPTVRCSGTAPRTSSPVRSRAAAVARTRVNFG